MSGTYEFIIYEKADRVAWITLNRPDAMNAQSDGLRMELVDALEQASERRRSIRGGHHRAPATRRSAPAPTWPSTSRRVPSYVVSRRSTSCGRSSLSGT